MVIIVILVFVLILYVPSNIIVIFDRFYDLVCSNFVSSSIRLPGRWIYMGSYVGSDLFGRSIGRSTFSHTHIEHSIHDYYYK